MRTLAFAMLLLAAGLASGRSGGQSGGQSSGQSGDKSGGQSAPGCQTIVTGSTDGPAASPENHTVLFENADARVLDVHSQPHTREAVHTHVRPAVMYVDRQGAGTYRTPDNSRNESHPTNPAFKPRTFATKPEGPHWTENTGEVPFHAVRVEFKHPGCALAGAVPATPGAEDELRVAPASETLLLETEEVRIIDVHVPPHGREPMHAVPFSGVEYVVQGAPIQLTGPDGQLQTRTFPPDGRIVAFRAGSFALENTADTPLHLIRFELKHGEVVP